MRKTIFPPTSEPLAGPEPAWLDLERLARVEVSSEDPAHPVEEALRASRPSGWRAGASGAQTLRLCFDEPQLLQRIRLHFEERQHERRQEFALRWSADGKSFHEIVRQQWNFSPSGSTREAENYVVALAGVSVLELHVVPDTSGGDAHASLAELRIA
ncbi:MAG TPA: hypothetical protein VH600_16015 [Burkholderiales bacterium]|jgi:hypothetical protein